MLLRYTKVFCRTLPIIGLCLINTTSYAAKPEQRFNQSKTVKVKQTQTKKVTPPAKPSLGNVVVAPGVSNPERMRQAHGHHHPFSKLVKRNNAVVVQE